jgi:phosphatidylglycerophosphatase A
MTETTDPATPSAVARNRATPRKPRLALFIATAGGLGYLKPGPGTWGSLGGLGLIWVVSRIPITWHGIGNVGFYLDAFAFTCSFVSLVGVWAAGRAERHLGGKDPQCVVVDEVSGQMITFFGAGSQPLNWKYLLAGFILFRVFDIWKPFPARQAEGLPGGWGIMADDWIAAIYAAMGLWIARALGL